MIRLPTTKTLRLALAAAVALLALACQGTTVVPGADPIIEPGPPALEPRMTQAGASSQYLETSEPGAEVILDVGFEDLDLTQLGQVPLVGTIRVEFLDGGVQSLELPLPPNTLASGSDPSAFAASLSNSLILAQEVAPGQSLGELLASVETGAYSVVFTLTGRDSELTLTNEVSTDVPRPRLTALSVAGGAPGQGVVSVLGGVNLADATRVLVSGSGVTATPLVADPRNDENNLVVRFDVDASAAAGSRTVRVVTPGGISATSSLVAFDVLVPEGPVFAAQTLPAASVGSLYQAALGVAGGTAPLTFSLVTGTLPAGLTLSASAGEITGTPTESGVFMLVFGVSDADAGTDQIPLNLAVAPLPADGRDDLNDNCDVWADAVVSSNVASLAARATGSTDGVPARLENIVSPLLAARATSLTAPLATTAELDAGNASYIVFDLGAQGCEHGVASAARTADVLLRDPDGYVDSIFVWASNAPGTLGRLVHGAPRNAGVVGMPPIAVDLGGDGMRFRYLTVASNDLNIPNIDSVEVLPEDTAAPETMILASEKLTVGLAPAANGPVLHAMFLGDDTEAGDNPAGVTAVFRYRFDLEGVPGEWREVTAVSGMGEIFEELTIDGQYELLVAAVDSEGNEDASPASVGFRIDTTPPEVTNLSPDPMAMNGYRAPTGGFATIELLADITDAGAGVSFVSANPAGAPDPAPFPMTAFGLPTYRGVFSAASFGAMTPASGTYVLQIHASDAFGNINNAQSTDVTVQINLPPGVSAGVDDTTVEGDPYLGLDASGTSDPEGDPFTLAWTQTGGPQVLLTGANTAAPLFSAPSIPTNTPVVLTFEVTASDNWNGVASDSVSVTVTNVNQQPLANAGADGYARSGQTVMLSGAGSSDADQDGLTLVWTQLPGGPTVSLMNPASIAPSFVAPTVGDASCDAPQCVLTFQLLAADGHGGSDTDTVSITVRDLNIPPVAEAGPASISVFDGNALTLDGSASYDLDGTIASRQWSLVAGNSALIPGWASIPKTFPTLGIPAFMAGGAAGFTFRLTVFDNSAAMATDDVVVNVEGYCAQSFSLIDRTQNFARPAFAVADESRDILWVLSPDDGGGLRRIDSAAGDQIGIPGASLTSGATALAVNESAGRVYWTTPQSGGRLVSYNVVSGSAATLTLGANYKKIATKSNGDVYVLNTTTGAVAVVTSALALRGTVALTLADPASADIAYNPVDGRIWVRDGGTITRINPATPAVADTFTPALGGVADGLVIDKVSGEAIVTHDHGFTVIATNLSEDDFTINGAVSAPYLVHPAEIGGHYYATDRAPGAPNNPMHRLYRVSRATKVVQSQFLTMTPDSLVRAAIAYDAANDEILVSHGPLAGASTVYSVGSGEALTAVAAIEVAGGTATALAPLNGAVYSVQSGGMVSRIDPVGESAQSIPLAFTATDLVLDPGTGDAYLGSGALQEMRIVIPGSPITVAGTDMRDRTDALTGAFDRGEILALAAARASASGTTQAVRLSNGVTSTLLSGPSDIQGVSGRSETLYDPDAGTGGVLYETYAAGPSILVTDLDVGPFSRQIALPAIPRSLHLDKIGRRLWVGAFESDVLIGIDIDEEGDPQVVVPTLGGPSEIVQSDATGLLYVRCELGDAVLAVDPDAATVAAIIDAGVLGRDDFAAGNERRVTLLADPSNANVYVIRDAGAQGPGVSVIESSLAHPVNELQMFLTNPPRSLALDDGRRVLFVTDGSATLRTIRLSEGYRVGAIALPSSPAETWRELVASDSAGGRLYVAGTHVMSLIDLNPGCATGTVQYGSLLDDSGEDTGNEVRYARAAPPASDPISRRGERSGQRNIRDGLARVLPSERCLPGAPASAGGAAALPPPDLTSETDPLLPGGTPMRSGLMEVRQ